MGDHEQSREERFTRLYDAHYRAVRAYAWRRDPDSADDVVAESFTIAWQRLDSVPAEALPWLIGVARNVRLNRQRGERRRREREQQAAPGEAVPSFIEALEAHSALADALRRLSGSDREILLLAAWERLDRAGLAAALGCSKPAATVRLFRARRRLATAMAEVEEPKEPERAPGPARAPGPEQAPRLERAREPERAPAQSRLSATDTRGGLLDEH